MREEKSILNNHSKAGGFSLIELLAVTAIISIVAGMIGVAAINARQKAYATIARTEVQQIAQALKAHWVAKGEWPKGFPPGQDTGLSADAIRESGLRGEADGNVYLELSNDRLEDASSSIPGATPTSSRSTKSRKPRTRKPTRSPSASPIPTSTISNDGDQDEAH